MDTRSDVAVVAESSDAAAAALLVSFWRSDSKAWLLAAVEWPVVEQSMEMLSSVRVKKAF